MKKKFILPIIIATLAIIGGGCYFYYYNYVEIIKHYYLVIYTPPQEIIDPFGYESYIGSRIEIKNLKVYQSDSIALADLTRDKEKRSASYVKELEKIAKQNPTDNIEQIKVNAQITALKGLIDEEWTILSVAHTRNFDRTKVKEVIKFLDNHQKIKEFKNKYKISVEIYPI